MRLTLALPLPILPSLMCLWPREGLGGTMGDLKWWERHLGAVLDPAKWGSKRMSSVTLQSHRLIMLGPHGLSC